MNDMIRVEQRLPLSAADVRAHVNLIQEVMQAVMKKDTHYGVIPGVKKPSLWKPGAEVLAATFRIAVGYPEIGDLSTEDCVRYRVVARGTHQATGIVMGDGMGECSSNEEKYKWRKASSKKEFDVTPENRRRIKYGYNQTERREYEIQQIRTEPADVANTILKMACKRAQVAMTLNVTAASDIFTQDIEDLPEELRHDDDDGAKTERTATPMPKAKSEATAEAGGAAVNKETGEMPLASEGHIKNIRAKLKALAATTNKGEDEITAECLAEHNIKTLDGITVDTGNKILAWIKHQPK